MKTPIAPRPLIELRKNLHTLAETSGNEAQTAEAVRGFLHDCRPSKLLDNIGGHGLAAVFDSGKPGPVVLYRAELDALPIPESLDIDHASRSAGTAHKCGHDGHMAIACGVAAHFGANKPSQGRVIVLFQPSEETGEGAARVLSDEKFKALHPDWVFALHNLPGFPLGEVLLRNGAFAAASVGLIVELSGATSHAAHPHLGKSPALALAALINAFEAIPQQYTSLDTSAQVTVIHARLGERAFGTSPGSAVLMATLRAFDNDTIESLLKRCDDLTRGIARAYDLRCEISTTEEFPASVNHPQAADLVRKAAQTNQLKLREMDVPFAWSEDFGHFLEQYPGALFGIGAGERHAALHHPGYDFPDELLEIAPALVIELVKRALEQEVPA